MIFLLACTTQAVAQRTIPTLTTQEYQAGHFNGTVLAEKNGRVVSQVSKGNANFQFGVPIAADTRFPIASMTKLFTAILTLQLLEKAQLRLDAPASAYVPDLPAACRSITLRELLTHTSGLQNEPVRAYQAAYSTKEFVQRFVVKDSTQKPSAFNYNNVDYILLTHVLETVTKKPFAALVQAQILSPLQMRDTGVLSESRVIPRLAYGYHNYTFGKGSAKDTLRNDRRYVSNYAGAGALYSTATDLLKLVHGVKAHTLLSAATTEAYLLKPQQGTFIDYARGYSTIGFFYNDKSMAAPILERRGSIDGFNSVLLTTPDFTKVVIILTNTDQADLETFGDKIYHAF
ncbi:beta-lactamase family protein [Hymenobacter sp. HSC-4F20]|uniref:serine hydrolase domain-containing protein n=1 Tax=Hymenobacter sp. HSC-4F20 TaxID=2864135 RepID=UPI001C7324DC|nr:serine hydrolase domain-containing protein [Hymenobacter sp. HSC-4F20]MBX0293106.1 beta-lactamase family protein [Hymenobacter sp. HSC-4F20]